MQPFVQAQQSSILTPRTVKTQSGASLMDYTNFRGNPMATGRVGLQRKTGAQDGVHLNHQLLTCGSKAAVATAEAGPMSYNAPTAVLPLPPCLLFYGYLGHTPLLSEAWRERNRPGRWRQHVHTNVLRRRRRLNMQIESPC